ncbi:MAG: hypothetical protein O7H39_11040, partial [Gammaproteobacteria bacterium]|nr:hypothetical protein [Gammaproteobacteria bacterium]
ILGCPSDGLVVVERTREAPAPPYVSAAPAIVDSGAYEAAEVFGLLSKALREVLSSARLSTACQALGLLGAEPVVRDDYLPIFERYRQIPAECGRAL